MHANKNNAVGAGTVAVDLSPFIRRYEDGHVERLVRSSFVPASDDLEAASGGVATRDIVVDHATGVSARLFLPSDAAAAGGSRRLPVVMYVHGGSFCTESAFSRTYHRYAASLAASAGALVVSVEYRLAPEHPIPAAYDDAWAALRWVVAAAASRSDDPWLSVHADPTRVFLAGDSVGGNIAYHTAVRAGRDGVDVEGVAVVQPYFWGPERLPSEEAWDGVAMFTPELVDRVWPFVTAGQAGNDDHRIDPPDDEIASLTCRRALVALAGKDILRDRARRLADRMRNGAWAGSVTLVELKGEDHGFHLYRPRRASSHKLMESMAQFINQPTTSPSPPLPRTVLLRQRHELHDAIQCRTKTSLCKGILTNNNMSRLTIGCRKAARTGYMLPKPSSRGAFKDPLLPAAIHGSCAIKNFF